MPGRTINTVNDRLVEQMENMDIAGKQVEQSIVMDHNFPLLENRLQIDKGVGTKSGFIDGDYPPLSGRLTNINLLKTIRKSPIPHEILEHLSRPHEHTRMGTFPEIGRAWIVIDTDIFIWDFEYSADVTYYDGLNERINGVGLVVPKPGVFKDVVHYLLVLTTVSYIVVLGITCKKSNGDLATYDELHIASDAVIYSVPSNEMIYNVIYGSENGRIFLGGNDGNLYELEYYSEYSWWGKRCKVVNRSSSIMSWLVPSVLTQSLANANNMITVLTIDNSRHVLYSLSLNGLIEMYDLGPDGTSISKKSSNSFRNVLHQTTRIMEEALNSTQIIHISAIEAYESVHFCLVAVTELGVRIYFAALIGGDNRPYNIQVGHVRMPPGYNGVAPQNRPSSICSAYYDNGSLLMVSRSDSGESKLWCLSPDVHVVSSVLSEMYCYTSVDGVSYHVNRFNKNLSIHSNIPEPPLIVRQLYEPAAKYVCLTDQGVQLWRKLRPVDILAYLFAEGNEPSSELIRDYLKEYSQDEACTMLLLLACQKIPGNPSVCEQAKRAFFLYGGEPLLPDAGPDPFSPVSHHNRSSLPNASFYPSMVSTPVNKNDRWKPSITVTIQQQQQRQQLQQQQQYFYQSPRLQQQSPQRQYFYQSPNNSNTTYSPQNPTNTMYQSMPDRSMESQSGIIFSAKHDSLYKYVGRILRLLWNQQVVHYVNCSRVADEIQYIAPPLMLDQCTLASSYLLALQEFFKQNSNSILPAVSGEQNFSAKRGNVPDISIVERRSLIALREFVHHITQILGLWRILYEHNFHHIVSQLTKEQQSMLLNTRFRDLFLTNFGLHSALITSMLNLCLGDSSSVESISKRLRLVCPSIYHFEDAACMKATDTILQARSQVDRDMKRELLLLSLQMLKEVAPLVNLETYCAMYLDLDFLAGIYELCYVCAKKVDEHNIASDYYHNKNNAASVGPGEKEYAIFVQRMECYKQLISCLNKLYSKSFAGNDSATNLSSSSLNMSGDFNPNNSYLLSVSRDSRLQFEELLSLCLSSDDELLHCALYDWMLLNKLQDRLSENASPHLEYYLKRPTTIEQFGSRICKNLLWKYYERFGNHASAAETLFTLATEESDDCSLQDRIEYLSHALVCMRCDKVGSAPLIGDVFNEIEEMYHVALVQRKVQKALSDTSANSPNIAVTVQQLNKKLYTLTQLYDKFVSRFNLSECMLAIVDCSTASFLTKDIINSTWEQIILSELQNCSSSQSDDKMNVVVMKVISILGTLRNGSPAVDIEFLVFQLELTCCRLGASKDHVVAAMLNFGIPYSKLITIYDKMYAVNNECWAEGGDEFHIIANIGCIGNCLINDIKLTVVEKKPLALRLHDMVTHGLNLLYSRQQTAEITNIIQWLKTVQKKLNNVF